MEILIKNMVCRHCVATVDRILKDAGLNVVSVCLGKAVISLKDDEAPSVTLNKVDRLLEANDFQRIEHPDMQLVEDIKHAVIRHVRNADGCNLNLSACIGDKLTVSYDNASRIFSRIEGRTIEKYHTLQRVEFVKELLDDPTLTLTEIAHKAGYSSVAHLSRRFKEVTGMTPTQYISSGGHTRSSIDKI